VSIDDLDILGEPGVGKTAVAEGLAARIGAGSALGAASDAAQVFKSVLARGEIRMIAATTVSEYKEYIQEDEAFARRSDVSTCGCRAPVRR
jgi:ATP-dependent Clp protease ATP-binding subunit ClpA